MHQHATGNYGKVFALGIGLNVAYIAVEVGFGLWANSLALLADAGHNLSDVLGLLLAWGGYALARIVPSSRRTYGWRGTTILAALFNALLLLAAIGGIVWEAIGRVFDHAVSNGPVIIVVASVGAIINTATALLFMRGREHDLNIRGAFLHMAADAGISVGVAVAGVLIYFTQLTWIDPAMSILIAVIILIGTWGLLRESVDLAIQAVPKGIDPEAVYRYLIDLPGVVQVHDLHIWAMSTTEVALTAHLVRPEIADDDTLLATTQHELHDRFGIEHMTLQIERSAEPGNCQQAPPDRL